jgi:hypothetical protein
MGPRLHVVLFAACGVLGLGCSDAAAPTTALTVSISTSATTVAAGDSVLATAVAQQSQNFVYSVSLVGRVGSDTLGIYADSTQYGSTRLSITFPFVAPMSAVGQYIHFQAIAQGVDLAPVQALDSVLVTQ